MAYINGFLARTVEPVLHDTDFQQVDRLTTLSKYILGPMLAGHGKLFDRGTEPMGALASLFKARNEIAHPRPRRDDHKAIEGKDQRVWLIQGYRREIVTAHEAACFLLAAAEAGEILNRALGDRSMATETVLARKPRLKKYAKEYDESRAQNLKHFIRNHEREIRKKSAMTHRPAAEPQH